MRQRQSNAPAQQPAVSQHRAPSPALAGDPPSGSRIASSGQINPRRPRNMAGMRPPGSYLGPPGPPLPGPYGMPSGGPGGMGLAIDPYGNFIGIPGPNPFDPMHRAPPGMVGSPVGHHFRVNIDSNNYYGDLGSGMVINDDMVIINGRDWSRIPPWLWPPHVMEQYQRGMDAGAQGMAEGARALEEAGEMMHNLGLNLGMGMHPPGMRRRNRRR